MKRNVNIYIPKGKSVYYANFRAKRKDPLKGIISVQVNRSTGSADKKTAQSIANHMRDQELLGLFDAVPKLRESCPTIGDIIERYVERCKLRTAEEVAREFLTVAAEGVGLRLAERDKALSLRVSVLTADAMLAFRDRPDQGRTNESINKLMRTAKSIFSRRAMEFYRDLRLPDISGWLKVSFLTVSEDKTFRRIEETTLAAMDGSTQLMRRLARWHTSRSNPVNVHSDYRAERWLNAWACYWIMRRCGLRNDEVCELRWEWLQERDGQVWISLVDRPYWKPKRSSGSVPMAADLYQSLIEIFGPATEGPEGFVLLGNDRSRWAGTHIEVNDYVRRFLPDRTKGVYELRKQWGSEMARRYGLETAAKLLRHKGIKTCWSHYFDDLQLETVKAI